MTKAAMSVLDRQEQIDERFSLRTFVAAIIPFIITGNLNATSIMMTEKIAAQIRGWQALVRSTAPNSQALGTASSNSLNTNQTSLLRTINVVLLFPYIY